MTTSLIREPEARRRLGGVSRTTFWRFRQDDIVPPPVKIRGQNYWIATDLDAAIARIACVGNAPSSTLLTEEVPDGLVN